MYGECALCRGYSYSWYLAAVRVSRRQPAVKVARRHHGSAAAAAPFRRCYREEASAGSWVTGHRCSLVLVTVTLWLMCLSMLYHQYLYSPLWVPVIAPSRVYQGATSPVEIACWSIQRYHLPEPQPHCPPSFLYPTARYCRRQYCWVLTSSSVNPAYPETNNSLMITYTRKMGFMNSCLQLLRGSSLHSLHVIKPFPSKLSVQRSQCRTVMLSQCWGNRDKSSPNENIDLDTWKHILRSGMPRAGSENTDLHIEEESSLESMQKLVEMWRMAGKAVPKSISTEQLQVLQELNTKSSRRKYLKDLLFKEYRKENRERKKLEKEELQIKMESDPETDNIDEQKTMKRPTYLLKFLTKCVECYEGWRGAQAMIFGQPLVFDMVYDHYMSHKEMKDTVGQLMMSEGFNKKSADPFHIHFCSLKPNGPYHNELVKRYQGAWNDVLITSTEKSHVDIFPRDQLVYLTSDSPNVLKKFDHDKIYIIGAFVDRSQKTGVSLANAKRLGLATARLPLDMFLKWSVGGKNLTLNQMTEILTILKDTEDWSKALSVVPERKHLGFLKESTSTKALSKHTKKYEIGKRKGGNQKEVHKDSAHQRKWWEERD